MHWHGRWAEKGGGLAGLGWARWLAGWMDGWMDGLGGLKRRVVG